MSSTVTETPSSSDLRTALAASESMNALLIEESLDRLESRRRGQGLAHRRDRARAGVLPARPRRPHPQLPGS
ncbi:hypothetical protein G5V59_02590 [Nocardioides sp. W3-2-3]|uniref:hypothetical protein n=1 Tax=Nocardioides convexus TaxID=2712224 RepID=UPI002418365A|nr:hypothetical protein [Nocardioides convexus]NGZ99641.1 hypothetical protein [Nocardioides convexus]